MKIIAIDDETPQLETIIEYLTELYPDAEINGFTKVSEVLAYIENQSADIALLDISMPGNINGINLGQILRRKYKKIKLLYCTGFSDYAMDAFKIHANGYLRKPIQKEDLRREMEYVLQMPVFDSDEKPYIHTFGNFDIFVNNRPVVFKRSKAKEILAYLVDREGAWVSNRDLIVVLWDEADCDTALSKYITTLVNEMISALERVNMAHIVERRRGRLRLIKNEVACDYFDYLNGDSKARLKFHNEYMSQYSWGENALAMLLEQISKNKFTN